jgi:hypothetical protein
VSDGVLTVDTSYSYDFSGFAPGAPSLDSVHATPWHIYSATAANPSLWFLDLFAKVANGSATSEVIRVTAVPPSGTVLNLRNDGVYPDSIANDDEWNGFPGSYTMVVDTGWVKFTATNQYYQSTEDSFHIDIICDSIPQVTSPDTLIGDIYGYASGVPQFYWLTYPGALYYQIAVSRMDYTYIWQPSAQLNDTTALYNFDNSATLIQLELFQDYILHLSVNKGNAWAKMEQVIRRVE